AWDSEMNRLTQGNSDQLNQLALTGRGQAFSEALAQRNQPLNEIIGLMSGSQIQNPNSTFAQTPQSQVAGVDYSGLVQNKYNQEVSAYNAKVGALGGLFGGLASTVKWSDARLKTNISRIGATAGGVPLYSYNYVWGGPTQIGVMAQEAPREAVIVDEASGYMAVDYSKVN